MIAAVIYRLLKITLGLIVATAAAAAVAIAFLFVFFPIAHWLITEGPLWGMVSKSLSPIGIFIRGFTSIMLLCLLPSALVIIWSEWQGTRSLRQYLAYSAIISFMSVLVLAFLVYYASPEIWRGKFSAERFALASIATFVFGLPASAAAGYAYWFVAGKRARRLIGSKAETA